MEPQCIIVIRPPPTAQAYMVLMSQMALSLFRALAALARNYDTANSFGSTALIIVLILSGFILAKGRIHPWWIWCVLVEWPCAIGFVL